MTRARLLIAAAALAFPLALAPALAMQAPRKAGCVAANDEVTRYRLGRDRAGRAVPVNIEQAGATGDRYAARCADDNGFLLAYALARIDLAKDVRNTPLASRTAHFNSALADLELVRRRVAAGQSDRFEVFNTLGFVYYETKQYEKAIAVLNASGPFFPRLTAKSRQNTLFTRGMAQYQLGRFGEARASFEQAAKYGHPKGAAWAAITRRKL